MAATYSLIAGKQIPEPPAEQNGNSPRKQAPRKQFAAAPKAKEPERKKQDVGEDTPRRERPRSGGPNVHLDIQIHIPADASVEQIDQIFESMARHLYYQ